MQISISVLFISAKPSKAHNSTYDSTYSLHFSTVSYNFRHRYTTETVDAVFAWILEEVAEAGYLSPKVVYVDGTHIKANANTKKQVKMEVERPFSLLLFPRFSTHFA